MATITAQAFDGLLFFETVAQTPRYVYVGVLENLVLTQSGGGRDPHRWVTDTLAPTEQAGVTLSTRRDVTQALAFREAAYRVRAGSAY
jgi:hypothetical protein